MSKWANENLPGILAGPIYCIECCATIAAGIILAGLIGVAIVLVFLFCTPRRAIAWFEKRFR